MPEPNSEEQVPELTEQQKYVNEKVAVLLDQIGDEYGESLTQQLVQRLDTTVADFHEEVTNLLSELKEKAVSRQERLRDAWQHRFDTPHPAPEGPAAATEATPAEAIIEEVVAPVEEAIEEIKESVEELIEEVTPAESAE